ncbi:helix-turn-helix domain-containing protein [Streptomyces sp. CA-106131]|uniref:TetR/AcrR family transcriptional regulator n=1 Tax=Streptomyces sp. CA-106131 TaxID=3240045 RepID=UPI003D92656E
MRQHRQACRARANRAGVGKPAVYRRWKSKEEILIAALSVTEVPLEPIDTGSVCEDLVTLARIVLKHQLSLIFNLHGSCVPRC